jgi:hypothetical protein
MAALTPRRAKLLLRIATVSLLAGAAIAIGLAARPLHLGAKPTPRGPASALPPLDAFASIWKADLRQPIPPTTRPGGTVDEGASVPIHLSGTLGPDQALIVRADGGVQAVSVGESVDGVEIVEVRSGQIIVRHNGHLSRISKPPEPNPLGGI